MVSAQPSNKWYLSISGMTDAVGVYSHHHTTACLHLLPSTHHVIWVVQPQLFMATPTQRKPHGVSPIINAIHHGNFIKLSRCSNYSIKHKVVLIWIAFLDTGTYHGNHGMAYHNNTIIPTELMYLGDLSFLVQIQSRGFCHHHQCLKNQ